jgi:hypothetical protein
VHDQFSPRNCFQRSTINAVPPSLTARRENLGGRIAACANVPSRFQTYPGQESNGASRRSPCFPSRSSSRTCTWNAGIYVSVLCNDLCELCMPPARHRLSNVSGRTALSVRANAKTLREAFRRPVQGHDPRFTLACTCLRNGWDDPGLVVQFATSWRAPPPLWRYSRPATIRSR